MGRYTQRPPPSYIQACQCRLTSSFFPPLGGRPSCPAPSSCPVATTGPSCPSFGFRYFSALDNRQTLVENVNTFSPLLRGVDLSLAALLLRGVDLPLLTRGVDLSLLTLTTLFLLDGDADFARDCLPDSFMAPDEGRLYSFGRSLWTRSCRCCCCCCCSSCCCCSCCC